MPSFGDINWAMLVHGEQSIEVFGEIPADGTVESVTKIVGIYDKGSGALAVMETESKYVDSGKPAFKVRMGAFIRGEGGFGDSRGPELPGARQGTGEGPGRGSHLRDPHRPGAAVPPLGRPQPVALRPVVRGVGRIPEADPARPLHLRRDRAGLCCTALCGSRPRPTPWAWTRVSASR